MLSKINQSRISRLVSYHLFYTKDIDRYYKFSYPSNNKKIILFYWEINLYQRVDLLLKYYEKINKNLSAKGYKSELRIISEGSFFDKINQAKKKIHLLKF